MGHSKCWLVYILPIIFLICFNGHVNTSQSYVQELDEDNWRAVLDGQWMLEFYAPWCPACNALAPVWKDLAQQFEKRGLKVGAIDVTKSPGLSGRFVVTALPTIFHVTDGVFRLYRGPRDLNSILTYVDDGKWKEIQPVSAWMAPNTVQMSMVSCFFKMSQTLRLIHEHMTEMWGLPTWACYLVFAVVTIVLGALVGLMLVCLIDLVYPPKKIVIERKQSIQKLSVKKDDGDIEEDSDADSLRRSGDDNADKDDDDDAEKNSQSDSISRSDSENSDKENAVEMEGGGDPPQAASADAQPRKRRPRKAD